MKTYSLTVMMVAFLASATPATSTWASVTTPSSGSGALGEWSWTVDGATSLSTAIYWQKGDGTTVFGITNGTDYIDLMPNTEQATWSILFKNSSAMIYDSSDPFGTARTLDLSNGTYTFVFKTIASNGGMTPQSNDYSKLYSWEYFDVANAYYLLTNETGNMQVSLFTNADEPSPVPVPGSALLLLSGVIGLASFRRHRNRLT